MRTQTDFQPQRQLHFVARVTEALDYFRDLRRVLNRFVDCRAYFLNYLFCGVVNIQCSSAPCWLKRGQAPVSLLSRSAMLREARATGQQTFENGCRFSCDDRALEIAIRIDYLGKRTKLKEFAGTTMVKFSKGRDIFVCLKLET